MNIKSLLLGSAAALLAVSGARAADAVEVVAEPEPMDYVRICDTYGAKFYYIPGTETCLRVGGYVRYEFGVGDELGLSTTDKRDLRDFLRTIDDGVAGFSGGLNDNDTYSELARLNVRLDARTETELGTLRSYGEFSMNWTTANDGASADLLGLVPILDGAVDGLVPWTDQRATFSVHHLYIDLAGFRMGRTTSAFNSFGGEGVTMNDDIAVGYGRGDTTLISYTFNGGNGFSGIVSLESGDGGSVGEDLFGIINFNGNSAHTIDSYVPHVVAGVAYEGGWGRASIVGGYDSVWEEFAVKGRLEVKASDTVTVYGMAAWKSNDDRNVYGNWSGDWAIYGGVEAKASEKLGIAANLAYDDGGNFSAELNLPYTVVSDFTVTPGVVYVDNFDDNSDGTWGAMIRFQRDF